MANTAATTLPSSESPKVEWTDIVRFVRQLSHDLRNHLNAAELQAAYLGEIATDPEVKDEIKRLREMIAGLGATLQQLSASVIPPKPTLIEYPAAEFMDDFRQKLETDVAKESGTVVWDIQIGKRTLRIDPQLMEQAFSELFSNAFRHGSAKPILVRAKVDTDRLILTLAEPKEKWDLSTENWGREPFRLLSHGHYGLGLNRVRAILEAHGGSLGAQYDKEAASLLTTVVVPLEKESP